MPKIISLHDVLEPLKQALFREGANREKLTMKKLIDNEIFFFTVYVPYKPWKIGVNREKIGTKPWKNRHQKSTIFSPLAFHRLRQNKHSWHHVMVIISSQICVPKLQRVFTLGDGCWLPIRGLFNSKGFLEGACKGFSVKTSFSEGFLEGSMS